jgi:4-amino-4-deoxy-L-arabinose transferase-like glycosyltransferase
LRKRLGKVSIALLILTFIVFAFGVGKIRGDIGTAILIIGVGLSLITALISEKGRWKTISISIVSIVIGVYAFLIIGYFFALMM